MKLKTKTRGPIPAGFILTHTQLKGKAPSLNAVLRQAVSRRDDRAGVARGNHHDGHHVDQPLSDPRAPHIIPQTPNPVAP